MDDRAIAGLVERLRDRLTVGAYVQPTHLHSPDYDKGRALLDEAAARIDALSARVKELEAANATQDQMIKNQTRRLQQRCDEVVHGVKPLAVQFDLNDCDDRKDDDAMEVRIGDLRAVRDLFRSRNRFTKG